MANARDLKRRIKSVKSTQQITKAMEMVAASKLRKAQGMMLAVRPYAHKMEDIISHVAESGVEHPFLEERQQVKNIAYLVIGSDRGLCGGYNGNLYRYLEQVLDETTASCSLVVIGRRAYSFCRQKGWPVLELVRRIGDNPTFNQARLLSERLQESFLLGEFDEIYVVYNEFVSAMSSLHRLKRLLPIQVIPRPESSEDFLVADYILEPDPASLLQEIMPQYLDMMVYSLLQEAKASEHSARMAAMTAATDNANEMIDKLVLSLNRARQAAITTEITEIVGGADALE